MLLVLIVALNMESYFTNINRNDGFWEEDFRRAAEIVTSQVEEKDAIIAAPERFMGAFCYYYCDRNVMDVPFGTAVWGRIMNKSDLRIYDIATVLENSRRVWVIQGFIGDSPRGEIPAEVQGAGELVGAWQVNALTVSLFEVQEAADRTRPGIYVDSSPGAGLSSGRTSEDHKPKARDGDVRKTKKDGKRRKN